MQQPNSFTALKSEAFLEGKSDSVRVLMIEDDAASQHLCKRFLTERPGRKYEITTAFNASEGLLKCQQDAFDCILIDYNLPDSSGTLVIRYLAQVLVDRAPPAIIITADESQNTAAEAVRAGAADFIPKRALSGESLARAIDNAVEKFRLKTAVNVQSKKLIEANEKLESKNEEIQRFYQGVSHEVKTPLTAAREFISLVKDGVSGDVTDKQIELLDHAISSCDQINEHFNDLLEISRLDAGKVIINKEFVSFDDVAIRAVASVSQAAAEKNIEIIHEMDESLPPTLADINRIIQVLSNLLRNAVKFSDDSTKIVLQITHVESDQKIHLSVKDQGCGIEKGEIESVFERLYQAENGAQQYIDGKRGLGLGLSIAKEIVELHDGSIWVDSVVGGGSTFTFSLPIADSILK